jgi:RNA exonuclease 1
VVLSQSLTHSRDVNTRFSGLTKTELDGAVMELTAVRAAACMWIGPETIIAGHGCVGGWS